MYKSLINRIVKSSLLMIVAVAMTLKVNAQGLPIDLGIRVEAGQVDIIKMQDLIKLAPGHNASGTRTLFSVTFKNNSNPPAPIKIGAGKMHFTGEFNGTPLGIVLKNAKDIIFPANASITLSSNTVASSNFLNFALDGADPDIDKLAKALGIDVKNFNPGLPVPSGAYTFKIWVDDGNSDEGTLNLTNIETNVVILGPGDEFGSGDVPEIYNAQPLISWTGGSPVYEVIVVQQSPSEKTLGDLLSKTPNFKTTTNGTSVQYPAVGVKPLLPGETYVLIVGSIVKDFSSTTDNRKYGTPYTFKIKKQQTGSESAGTALVEALKKITGGQYDAAFDQLKEASPTGKMSLDDKPIGINDLNSIMKKISEQTYSLKGIAIK